MPIQNAEPASAFADDFLLRTNIPRYMRRTLAWVLLVILLGGPVLCGEASAPWWKEEKIRFMWGVWGLHGADTPGVNYYERDVPREVFRNVALAGGTVFVDTWQYSPVHAQRAKEFGLRYFPGSHFGQMPLIEKGRTFVNRDGEEVRTNAGAVKCPLEESIWEWWLADDSRMEGLRAGLIDGLHTDWEATDHGICFCDDCFTRFLERQGIETDLPDRTERFPWLKERGLAEAYEDAEGFSQRRFEMFTRIRRKLQAVKPDLVFSAYGTLISDFTRAMNTPSNPFIYLDSRHYINDDRQPWWESYSARLKQEGYLHIPGGWTNALFGSQPSQVSAARWIYEAAINEDGVWIWFEHELDDEFYRAYSIADSNIKAAESAVGRFLFQGERDPGFVTAVEWTGRPELQQAVIVRTYHLNDEHLVHVNNVHSEWPVRVRLRFPRLPEDGRWTVHDPMRRRYTSLDGSSAVWTSADLLGGVVVTMEFRSDRFLVLAPAEGPEDIAASQLMYSREFDALPDHAVAASSVKDTPSKARVEPDSIFGEYLDQLLLSTEKVFELPKEGWRFQWDQGNVGVTESWFLSQSPLDGWEPIEIERFWGDQGGTEGAGWYRADVDIPALPAGKRVYLHFGAVDEELQLWVNGGWVGEYDRGPQGWDKPFALDVTEHLKSGRNHLALRVYNSAYAGGVWKPASVLVGPDKERETAPLQIGRLVYTATEPMGFGLWHSGVQSIVSNAICTIDSDNTDQLQLRHLRGHLWSPAYSPVGRRIVFVHDAGGRGQIHVMNEDGSGAANLSDNGFCDRSPVWSPDGTKIAFLSDRTGDWDLYVMNADGSAQRRLAGNPGLDRAPAWSPDGKRVVWESHTSGIPTIWVCDADGRNGRRLIPPDRPLTVGGSALGQDEVFDFAEVELPFRDNTLYLMNPVWSPDGTRIAVVGVGAYSGHMVVLLSADGRRMWPVIKWIVGVDGKLVWSPDGTRLAGTLRTAPQETERSGIFVVNVDGKGDYRRLVDVTPQGPRLGGASRQGLVTWYSHGSAQPRRVLKSFHSLAWSPGGETIAFSSDMSPTGAFYVYTIDPEGGQARRLDDTMSAWPQEVMWRP